MEAADIDKGDTGMRTTATLGISAMVLALAAPIALSAPAGAAPAQRTRARAVLQRATADPLKVIPAMNASIEVEGTKHVTVGIYPQLGLLVAVKKKSFNVYQPDPSKVVVTAKHIKFKLGSLGKVDLRFKPKPGSTFKNLKRRSRCSGTPNQARHGTWKGTLKFTGEKSFTKVNVTKVQGLQVKLGGVVCKAPKLTGGLVELTGTSPDNRRFFSAVQKYPDNPVTTSMSLTAAESTTTYNVTRTARFVTSSPALSVSGDNSHATLFDSLFYEAIDPEAGGKAGFLTGSFHHAMLGKKVTFGGADWDGFLQTQ